MKSLFTLLVLPLFLQAFSISIDSGFDEHRYSIINIKDDDEFSCVSELLAYDKQRYICELEAQGLKQLEDLSLNLVDIRYKVENKKLFVFISPKTRSRLFNLNAELFSSNRAGVNLKNRSKHFSILIDPALSEFSSSKDIGLNFAPEFFELLRPSVGALDLNKAPIDALDSGDIDVYVGIKKAYDAAQYARALAESKRALKDYARSIFAAEFGLYFMRSASKVLSANEQDGSLYWGDVIVYAKTWLFNNGSDKAYDEVLHMLAKAYIMESHLNDAGYVLDILLAEHPDSLWTQRTQLDYASAIYSNGKANEARELVQKVLYSTKDVQIASRAALWLANENIDQDEFNLAQSFVLKVLQANSKYFLNNIQSSLEMASAFAKNKMPNIAAKIYAILAQNKEALGASYEEILKDWALSLASSDDKKAAFEALNLYKKDFPHGDYIEEINHALDGLFFDDESQSQKELHERYERLMQEYSGSEIAQKALIKDLELSLKNGEFANALKHFELASKLKDEKALSLINLAALNLAKQDIKAGNCASLMGLLGRYDVDREALAQFKLYECYERTSHYGEALALARSQAGASNLLDRVVWLSYLAQQELRAGSAQSALKAANDAIALGARVEYSDISRALFVRLNALLALKNLDAATQTMAAIEQLSGYDIQKLEAYNALANAFESEQDFAGVKLWASKALALGARLGVGVYSPQLDFTLINALIRLGELNQAVLEINSLLAKGLSPANRQRALASLSQSYLGLKQTQKAKQALSQCLGDNFESEFRASCQRQLELMEYGK